MRNKSLEADVFSCYRQKSARPSPSLSCLPGFFNLLVPANQDLRALAEKNFAYFSAPLILP